MGVPLVWLGIGHWFDTRASWMFKLCRVIIVCAVLVLNSLVGKIGCSMRIDLLELAAF